MSENAVVVEFQAILEDNIAEMQADRVSLAAIERLSKVPIVHVLFADKRSSRKKLPFVPLF